MQEDILEELKWVMDYGEPVDILVWMMLAKDEIIRLREYEWMYNDLNK